ncbi:DAGKc domain-containing protein [Aphelenchoides bicaudatus]|nr:DAGKc domain-containing protein [Aphelenchoides bicaudatus]
MCKLLCCCCSQKDEDLNVTDFQSVVDSSSRLLIFVNPKSGSGRGARIFKDKILPILQQNSIGFELIQTNAPGHAGHIVSERNDLDNFNAIVIVSGDGLCFEVINSVVLRSDASKLLKQLPLAIVPCGSGNGLLSSVFAYRQKPIDEKQFLNTAVETLAHPEAISLPVNLVKVQTNSGLTLASFLSIGFGLMSDIDIESESLRTICGGNRFYFGALWRVANLRKYKARLSFVEAPADLKPSNIDPVPVFREKALNGQEKAGIPSDINWPDNTCVNVPDLNEPIPSNWTTIDDEFLLIYAVSISHISNVNIYAPNSRLNEEQIHLTYILKKDVKSRTELAKFLSAIESQNHLNLPFCKYVKVQSFRLEPDEQQCRRSPIVIDGEVIPETAIQATATNECIRVVSK